MTTFKAIWPVTDRRLDPATLIRQATDDLPLLLAQAHARPTGRGRWSLANSLNVAGSGRVTPTVLVFECPAEPIEARPYHRRPLGVVA